MATTVPVDIERDGEYEFMDRGGGWARVKLVSAKGQLLWSFPPQNPAGPAANQMTAADIDGDGLLEFIVGMNAGGLYALEHDGSVKWRLDAANVFVVESLDLDGDGHEEIVYGGRRSVVIRQPDGTAIRHFEFPGGPLHPFVWKLGGQAVLLGRKGNSLYCLDPFGNETLRVPLPRSKGYPGAMQPIRFGGTLYYASANQIAYTYDVGHLYIFDAQGQVFYYEEFPRRVHALSAIEDSQNSKNDILLIGVGTQLIEYRMTEPK